MIIKSLLFIIVCIFAYEIYNNLTKMSEEYFTTLENESFVSLSNDPEKNDISKTIAINCKSYLKKANSLMSYKPDSDESLDTTMYSRFNPLEYNPKRQYYWKAQKLVEEGIRRSKDDEAEIAKVQKLFDNETDPDKKQILQDELNLFKWRKNILSNTYKDSGLERKMNDIETDYFPEEIGMNRPWIEIHSHIPDYSY